MSCCTNNCCSYTVVEYPYKPYHKKPRKKNRKKAGVFLYDQKSNRVLLVQSHGKLWGPPKGSVEENETFLQCAKRELLEETGICLDESMYKAGYLIKSNTYYYCIPIDECNVTVQTQQGNDANGIGWFNIDCITNGKYNINQHCKLTFRRFLQRNPI
jgi:8-oxo-dGTP pyrophosphatase MutT (NUDIX family)